jgi:hypothetical protein
MSNAAETGSIALPADAADVDEGGETAGAVRLPAMALVSRSISML